MKPKRYASIFFLILLLGAIPLTPGASCKPSQQRLVFNTLATTGMTVNAAYAAYLDTVVKGQTTTNAVPKVSQLYNDFQKSYALALSAAQFNPTNIAPADLVTLANQVVDLINTAKGH
jgi:hypothetical protein